MAQHRGGGEQDGQALAGDGLHQKAVPTVNWIAWILSPANLRTGLAYAMRSGPIGETHDTPRPTDARMSANEIFSCSPQTLPASANANMRSDRSLPAPGNGELTSALSVTFLAPPTIEPVTACG